VAMSHSAIHQRLRKERGPAREYPCISCGKTAYEWAYQHQGEELQDIRGTYSENIADYEAMCRSCHRRLDKAPGDPDIGQKQRDRVSSDPEYAARVREQGRQLAAKHKERMRSDPEYREQRVRQARSSLNELANQERRCEECGYAGNPGVLGRHQKSTNHSGWEATT
jgi:DNA-directed RNA polymerase subunit RPC12/RpoP